MKVLIGSRRILQLFPDFYRQSKDIDFAFIGETYREDNTEYLNNPVLINYLKENNLLECDLNILYTLKCSHLIRNVAWNKHYNDIKWMKRKGAKLIYSLFIDLANQWLNFFSIKRSNLSLEDKEFFNNALKTGVDHDYLHTLIENPPTYLKVLKEGKSVEPCEIKFNLLSFDDKIKLVKEEVMVMAWERYREDPYQIAYTKMLKKFIKDHAPLFEVAFILENYDSVCKIDFNYISVIDNYVKT